MQALILGEITKIVFGWVLDRLLGWVRELPSGLFAHRRMSKDAMEIAQAFEGYSRGVLREAPYAIASIGHIQRPESSEISGAWKSGVNGILLVGAAGSGKSGLALDLAQRLLRNDTPVFFVRATAVPPTSDPATFFSQLLPKKRTLQESLTLLGREHECVVMIDQLDSIADTAALPGFVSLMKSLDGSEGVRILGLSRTYEAEHQSGLRELNFPHVESRELSPEFAKEYLSELGIKSPNGELVELAQNLLNLSLISELVSAGNDISSAFGVAQLWEQYLMSIQERDGEQAYLEAMRLADECQKRGGRDFGLQWSRIGSISRLLSRGLILQIPDSLRFRFRHEQLQTFLCAYFRLPDFPTPESLVDSYGKFASRELFVWLCILYGLKSPDHEATFVESVLRAEDTMPYYTQLSVLRQYMNVGNLPSGSRVAHAILDAIRSRSNLRAYFFRGGPSVAWASLLWDNGFFSNPPEPKKTAEGSVLEPWDAQYYLIAIAPQVPGLVVNHIKTIKGHARYLARAIEAATKIPAAEAEMALPTIIDWLQESEMLESLQDPAATLMDIMIQDGRWGSGFDLFAALVAPHLEPSRHFSSRAGFIRDRIVGPLGNPAAGFKMLMYRVPERLIQVLEQQLVRHQRQEAEAVNQPAVEFRSGWRSAIEDTDQDILDTYQNVLICALRDSLEEFARTYAQGAEAIIRRYLGERHSILRRLALYVIRQHKETYPDLVSQELLNRGNLDDLSIHHQWFLLLERCYSSLSASQREVLLTMILDGPDKRQLDSMADWAEKTYGEDRANYRQDQQSLWIRNRLWMIRDDLGEPAKTTLNNLVAQYGTPEHPDLLAWTSGVYSVVDVSPFTEEELLGAAPHKLLKLIREWRPSPGQHLGPKRISYLGLAGAVANVVLASPQSFSDCIGDIASIRPEFARAIIGHWINPDKKGRIDWSIAIRLCEALIGNPVIWNGSQEDIDEATWRDVRLSIAMLMEVGISHERQRAPDEYLPRIRDILLRLIEDSDPMPRDERSKQTSTGFGDPSTVALNHVRPVALSALITYAMRRKELGEKSSEILSLEGAVRGALATKVDIRIESSRSVHSVFGRYLPSLYWLDRQWVEDSLGMIFPVDSDEESKWLFASAWDSYIPNRYNPRLFRLLRSQYERAVRYLTEGYTSTSFLQPEDNLAVHLAFDYLASEIGTLPADNQAGLLREFTRLTGPETRGKAGWALWVICRDNLHKVAEYWPKAKAFWEWCLREASVSSHPLAFELEMAEFSRLLLVAPPSEDISSMGSFLDGLLPYMRGSELRDTGWNSVETFLAERVDRDPLGAIRFYRLMHEQKANRSNWIYHTDEAKKIIGVAAANRISRADALSLIDFLAQWNDFTFQELYDRYSKWKE